MKEDARLYAPAATHAVEVMGNFGPRVVKGFVHNLERFGLECRSRDQAASFHYLFLLAIASVADGRERLRLVKPPKVHNAVVLLLQLVAYAFEFVRLRTELL